MSTRMTRGTAPGTSISWAQSSGTRSKPSLRAAVAGNAASRSGVTVNRQLTTVSACSALRAMISCMSSSVAARMSPASLRSTVVAPRRAKRRIARGMMPAVVALALASAGCGQEKLADGPPPAAGGLTVSSADFADQGPIPVEDSCHRRGRRPALRWSGVPAAAREVVGVVTDPDAGGFVHWTVYGLHPRVRALAASGLPRGAREGTSSTGARGWTPPCPPATEQHRYLFDVYWLRRPSGLQAGAGPKDVAAALSAVSGGHGELVGRFRRAA